MNGLNPNDNPGSNQNGLVPGAVQFPFHMLNPDVIAQIATHSALNMNNAGISRAYSGIPAPSGMIQQALSANDDPVAQFLRANGVNNSNHSEQKRAQSKEDLRWKVECIMQNSHIWPPGQTLQQFQIQQALKQPLRHPSSAPSLQVQGRSFSQPPAARRQTLPQFNNGILEAQQNGDVSGPAPPNVAANVMINPTHAFQCLAELQQKNIVPQVGINTVNTNQICTTPIMQPFLTPQFFPAQQFRTPLLPMTPTNSFGNVNFLTPEILQLLNLQNLTVNDNIQMSSGITTASSSSTTSTEKSNSSLSSPTQASHSIESILGISTTQPANDVGASSADVESEDEEIDIESYEEEPSSNSMSSTTNLTEPQTTLIPEQGVSFSSTHQDVLPISSSNQESEQSTSAKPEYRTTAPTPAAHTKSTIADCPLLRRALLGSPPADAREIGLQPPNVASQTVETTHTSSATGVQAFSMVTQSSSSTVATKPLTAQLPSAPIPIVEFQAETFKTDALSTKEVGRAAQGTPLTSPEEAVQQVPPLLAQQTLSSTSPSPPEIFPSLTEQQQSGEDHAKSDPASPTLFAPSLMSLHSTSSSTASDSDTSSARVSPFAFTASSPSSSSSSCAKFGQASSSTDSSSPSTSASPSPITSGARTSEEESEASPENSELSLITVTTSIDDDAPACVPPVINTSLAETVEIVNQYPKVDEDSQQNPTYDVHGIQSIETLEQNSLGILGDQQDVSLPASTVPRDAPVIAKKMQDMLTLSASDGDSHGPVTTVAQEDLQNSSLEVVMIKDPSEADLMTSLSSGDPVMERLDTPEHLRESPPFEQISTTPELAYPRNQSHLPCAPEDEDFAVTTTTSEETFPIDSEDFTTTQANEGSSPFSEDGAVDEVHPRTVQNINEQLQLSTSSEEQESLVEESLETLKESEENLPVLPIEDNLPSTEFFVSEKIHQTSNDEERSENTYEIPKVQDHSTSPDVAQNDDKESQETKQYPSASVETSPDSQNTAQMADEMLEVPIAQEVSSQNSSENHCSPELMVEETEEEEEEEVPEESHQITSAVSEEGDDETALSSLNPKTNETNIADKKPSTDLESSNASEHLPIDEVHLPPTVPAEPMPLDVPSQSAGDSQDPQLEDIQDLNEVGPSTSVSRNTEADGVESSEMPEKSVPTTPPLEEEKDTVDDPSKATPDESLDSPRFTPVMPEYKEINADLLDESVEDAAPSTSGAVQNNIEFAQRTQEGSIKDPVDQEDSSELAVDGTSQDASSSEMNTARNVTEEVEEGEEEEMDHLTPVPEETDAADVSEHSTPQAPPFNKAMDTIDGSPTIPFDETELSLSDILAALGKAYAKVLGKSSSSEDAPPTLAAPEAAQTADEEYQEAQQESPNSSSTSDRIGPLSPTSASQSEEEQEPIEIPVSQNDTSASGLEATPQEHVSSELGLRTRLLDERLSEDDANRSEAVQNNIDVAQRTQEELIEDPVAQTDSSVMDTDRNVTEEVQEEGEEKTDDSTVTEEHMLLENPSNILEEDQNILQEAMLAESHHTTSGDSTSQSNLQLTVFPIPEESINLEDQSNDDPYALEISAEADHSTPVSLETDVPEMSEHDAPPTPSLNKAVDAVDHSLSTHLDETETSGIPLSAALSEIEKTNAELLDEFSSSEDAPSTLDAPEAAQTANEEPQEAQQESPNSSTASHETGLPSLTSELTQDEEEQEPIEIPFSQNDSSAADLEATPQDYSLEVDALQNKAEEVEEEETDETSAVPEKETPSEDQLNCQGEVQNQIPKTSEVVVVEVNLLEVAEDTGNDETKAPEVSENDVHTTPPLGQADDAVNFSLASTADVAETQGAPYLPTQPVTEGPNVELSTPTLEAADFSTGSDTSTPSNLELDEIPSQIPPTETEGCSSPPSSPFPLETEGAEVPLSATSHDEDQTHSSPENPQEPETVSSSIAPEIVTSSTSLSPVPNEEKKTMFDMAASSPISATGAEVLQSDPEPEEVEDQGEMEAPTNCDQEEMEVPTNCDQGKMEVPTNCVSPVAPIPLHIELEAPETKWSTDSFEEGEFPGTPYPSPRSESEADSSEDWLFAVPEERVEDTESTDPVPIHDNVRFRRSSSAPPEKTSTSQDEKSTSAPEEKQVPSVAPPSEPVKRCKKRKTEEMALRTSPRTSSTLAKTGASKIRPSLPSTSSVPSSSTPPEEPEIASEEPSSSSISSLSRQQPPSYDEMDFGESDDEVPVNPLPKKKGKKSSEKELREMAEKNGQPVDGLDNGHQTRQLRSMRTSQNLKRRQPSNAGSKDEHQEQEEDDGEPKVKRGPRRPRKTHVWLENQTESGPDRSLTDDANIVNGPGLGGNDLDQDGAVDGPVDEMAESEHPRARRHVSNQTREQPSGSNLDGRRNRDASRRIEDDSER